MAEATSQRFTSSINTRRVIMKSLWPPFMLRRKVAAALFFLQSTKAAFHHIQQFKTLHDLRQQRPSTAENVQSLFAAVESPPLAPAEISAEDKVREETKVLQDNVFELLAGRSAVCLLESDIRRDAIGKEAGTQASSATNWINDASAFALQKAFDRLRVKLSDERSGLDRDKASSWLRWMKTVPSPMIVDYSNEFREIMASVLSNKSYELIDQTKTAFLNRVGCRMILLPSGSSLQKPLSEFPASVIYGKLLYGGVTRSRLLVSSNSRSPPRQAGVRQEVKIRANDNPPVWMMYGGPDRMYTGVDIGPAAVLEVVLLPRGKSMEGAMQGHMVIDGFSWQPQQVFDFVLDDRHNDGDSVLSSDMVQDEITNEFSAASLSGQARNEAFRSSFQSSVGGLQPQIDAIVRRVLDGRIIQPADDDEKERSGADWSAEKDTMLSNGDATSKALATNSLEAEELALIGLTPVRGLLLYGPPGCGKTALAREISRALRARAPKIVSAPELLDRWVGGSEKLVRALFADAEAELAACNGDESRSALHVVVIDEIDAVFRKRTSAEDSGESTRSSVVNQILAKMDGVNAIPNTLLIGMTNRRELLDEALLRPGRLEVQIEIPLPDKRGRREILQIHFGPLRERGRLSKPLCCAIDGVVLAENEGGSEIEESRTEMITLQKSDGKSKLKRTLRKLVRSFRSMSPGSPSYDLAADYATGGFSGADIAGLVRCAGSIALARSRQDGNGIEGLLITLEDVVQAIEELKG